MTASDTSRRKHSSAEDSVIVQTRQPAPSVAVRECGLYGCTVPARIAYCTPQHREWDELRARDFRVDIRKWTQQRDRVAAELAALEDTDHECCCAKPAGADRVYIDQLRLDVRRHDLNIQRFSADLTAIDARIATLPTMIDGSVSC